MARRLPGYARIRLGDGMSRLIKIERENDGCLYGVRVRPDGSPFGSENITCPAAAVIERLVLNTYYGSLEPI